MPLSPGTKLGSYEILAALGAGGMGEVYKAKDLKLGRDVAIKVLREELASDPDRLRRFEQEARAASALNHPNIVHIYDIGQQDSTRYIAMEYVEGATLREMLGGGPLPTKKLLQLGTQIADGLAKAHSAGIVHRDLKPENLMVTSDGFVKILDFGLAKLLPQLSGTRSEMATIAKEGTTPGVVMGTAGYMSPEQAKGQAADFHSDQFSLGAVLYEMASGRRAFQADTAGETLAAIIRDQPESVAKINPDVPAPFKWIVERCLAKDKEDRWASTRDLAHDLQNVRDHLDEVPSAPVVAEPQPKVRSRRAAILSLFGLLVVVLALMVGLNVGGLRQRLFGKPSPSRIDSLAVLPLENLSGDPEQEYFADGMTEALIADLATISALRVISRQSVMRYKGSDASLPEIARVLGVEAVVEGSVLRSGNRVRITTQLVQASPEQHLWANSYERELRDILSMQSEVARAIAQEIRVAVTPQEQARLASARPINPGAHQAYLRGRYYLEKRTQESLQKALGYFQRAIEEDPDFALAYAGVATSYNLLGDYAVVPPADAYPKAKEAALKALEMNDKLAEAHTALAWTKFAFDFDWAGAERGFRLAIELNPSYATARQWYGEFLTVIGHHQEAMEQISKAREVDPLSLIINVVVGYNLFYSRQYDLAIEQHRRTLELDRNFVAAHALLGQAYLAKGTYLEAVTEYQKAIALGGPLGLGVSGFLGNAYARAGMKEEAYKVLDELKSLSRSSHVPPITMAYIYVGLDEKDQAIQWLEKGYELRQYEMTEIKLDPIWDPLRSDPRFQDLVRRMNFPD
jgi:serine/threonine protein kinase/tetratricopeptide (TPR) repeat protein